MWVTFLLIFLRLTFETPDYDQYYRSLAASASASAQATPSGLGLPGRADFDDFNDDEEDTKPSIEYLDSLNAYRKRSRSQEDEGRQLNNKLPRTNDNSLNGSSAVHTPEESQMSIDQPPEDDPLVSGMSFANLVALISDLSAVNGVQKEYSKVTEEDHDLMTPEEYEAFFQIMQARS